MSSKSLAARWEKSKSIVSDEAIVQRILDAADHKGEYLRHKVLQWVQDYATTQAPMESPIEVLFFAWWWSTQVRIDIGDWFHQPRPYLALLPQHEVDLGKQKFRLDFVVVPSGPEATPEIVAAFPRVAIELDGHEFHERTKAQVERRNLRDSLLQQADWKVFHVSGSELWNDPWMAVDRIQSYCVKAISKNKDAA